MFFQIKKLQSAIILWNKAFDRKKKHVWMASCALYFSCSYSEHGVFVLETQLCEWNLSAL